MINVTQTDRDAADYIWKEYGPFHLGTLHVMYEAFASHRLATIEECAKVADEWRPQRGAGAIATGIRALKDNGHA